MYEVKAVTNSELEVNSNQLYMSNQFYVFFVPL